MKIVNIILLVVWMSVIFMLSNQKAEDSASLSSGLVREAYTAYHKVVHKEVNNEKMNSFINQSKFIVRKTAHFTEFLILGLLIINVLKDYMVVDKKLVIICIICSLVYAVSDEVHQLFIDKRACRVTDILIDTFGSSVGICLYYMLKKRRTV